MGVQDQIIAMWDRAAERYDMHVGHGMSDQREQEAWAKALTALLPPPPASVLDAGTGTGAVALLLARLGYDVLGVDLSVKMLERAQAKAAASRLRVRFEQADAAAPRGAPETFDVAFSRHLVHMLPDPAGALANWRRLLRPGGRVIIVDGLWGSDPEDHIPDDIQAALPLRAATATTDDVVRLAEAAGFVDVTVSDLAAIDQLEHELATEAEPASDIAHYVVTGVKRG